MVEHISHSSACWLRQESHQFETKLNYMERPGSKSWPPKVTGASRMFPILHYGYHGLAIPPSPRDVIYHKVALGHQLL